MLDNGTRHPNLALLKIAGFLFDNNVAFELIEDGNADISKYHRIYLSKVFSFTKLPDFYENASSESKEKFLLGGTGFYANEPNVKKYQQARIADNKLDTNIYASDEAPLSESVDKLTIQVAFVVGIVALIAFFEQAQRRIQILYPRQVMSNGVVNTNASYLPIKINMSGVMGPVFASSIMMLPAFVQRFVQSENLTVQTILGFFTYGTWSYIILFTVLIAFFAFFQTAVIFNSEETSSNLKNAGGYIPGVRPGEQTVKYLDNVVSRTTAIGVAYLIVVCVLPIILNTHLGMPLAIGGTSVLIVAGVVLDTVNQVQSYLVAKQYSGVIKKVQKKGRFRG